MTPSINLNDILKLSLPERILWVEAIWNSIAADKKSYETIPLSPDQMKFLDKIEIGFEANPHISSTLEEVKQNILKLKK